VIPTFEELTSMLDRNRELGAIIESAALHYELGSYSSALAYFEIALRRFPAVQAHLYYHVRVCRRVLGCALLPSEAFWERANIGNRLFATFLNKIGMKVWPWYRVRCKWCGHLTRFVHPDRPTYGFAGHLNGCSVCHNYYPMPSFYWDSPEGRSYSYGRQSFGFGANGSPVFYEEFQRDYPPSIQGGA
jgi:hypothetical protein